MICLKKCRELAEKYEIPTDVVEAIWLAAHSVVNERVYQLLELHGVPCSRAKSIANGIEVLVSRFQRDINDLKAALAMDMDKNKLNVWIYELIRFRGRVTKYLPEIERKEIAFITKNIIAAIT